MNGKLKSIFYLVNRQHEEPSLYWNITSKKLNLNDFTVKIQFLIADQNNSEKDGANYPKYQPRHNTHCGEYKIKLVVHIFCFSYLNVAPSKNWND